MSDAFYAFIGAIEATVHFISTQKSNEGPSLVPFSPDPAFSDPLMDENKVTAYKSILEEPVRKVRDELNTLLAVKTALLVADTELSRKLKEKESGSPDAGLKDVTKEKQASAWTDFDKVLSFQASIFAGAVQRLQANAPEWSCLDVRLCQMLDWFRAITPTGGGDPGNEFNTSWGSTFGSSASQSSSTSVGYVPSSSSGNP